MPLGYEKERFSSILQDIIYIVTIQLAFLGLEIDSKFGIELTISDQNTLDLFVYRFKIFLTLIFIWISFTCVYFAYRYGLTALMIYLFISIIFFGYVVLTYNSIVSKISKRNNLKLRYFNSHS